MKKGTAWCFWHFLHMPELIEFLQLSENFLHARKVALKRHKIFRIESELKITECGSSPVGIFKFNVFSMVNGKILTAQCALL